MRISTAGVYPEAGINFNVSYKFNKLLRETLSHPDENFANTFNSVHGEEYSLGIILSAKSNSLDLVIKGPSISKKYKVVDYILYIPFGIINQKDFFVRYVDFVCIGIKEILDRYIHSTIMHKKLDQFKEEALKNKKEFLE